MTVLRILPLALLLLASPTFAESTTTSIPCPSIANIQQVKSGIDSADPYWTGDTFSMFITSSTQPVLNMNNLAWTLHVWGIPAQNAADAISRAKDSLQTLDIYSQYAELENNEFVCRYNWSEHTQLTPALAKLTAPYR